MRNELLQIFLRRHACHQFLPDRALPREDLEFILEAGRLSPSSFGLEPWRFIVCAQAVDKQALQAACFGQAQVGSASVVVVILARLAELHPDSPYVRRLMAREYPQAEALQGALRNYREFHAAADVPTWSAAQCHIAAANMMTAAAGIGVDSCAIGGFIPGELCRVLDIDARVNQPVLVLPLGYCAHPAGEKQRLALTEMLEYR